MNDDEDRIKELETLESPVSETFLEYVRRKIHRREATAQLAYYSFNMPLTIFIEFLSIIGHLFQVADGKKGRSR